MEKKLLQRSLLFMGMACLAFLLSCEESETPLSEIFKDVNSSPAPGGSTGTALAFDGVDDYVIVADDPSLDMTTGFTVTAWIYLKDYTEWASVVTKGGEPTMDNNYTLHQSGPDGGGTFGKLRFSGSSPALPLFLESNTVIPLGEWHHVAMTYDGSELSFYLDGVYDGGGALPGPLTPNNNFLFIGADPPGAIEYWQGAIDEVKIWNVALSQKHIKASMHGAATPRAGNLAAFWRFNEGTGFVAHDKTANNNHGKLINGPTWFTP